MNSLSLFLIGHIKTNLVVNNPRSVFFSESTPGDLRQLFADQFTTNTTKIVIGNLEDEINKKARYDIVVVFSLGSAFTSDAISPFIELIGDGGRIICIADNSPRGRVIDSINSTLQNHGLQPHFIEPLGKLSKVKDGAVRPLPIIGNLALNSRLYSPIILAIYQRQTDAVKYVSETSFLRRLYRVHRRSQVYIDQRPYISVPFAHIRHTTRSIIEKMGLLLGVHNRRYAKNILPYIPRYDKDPSKTRLVIAMTWMEVGGVERVMLNIIKGLDKKKFDIHILTTVPSTHPWEGAFKEQGATVTHVAEIFNHQWPASYQSQYIADYISLNEADSIMITNSHTAYYAIPLIRTLSPGCGIYDLLHTHGTPRDDDAFLKVGMPYDQMIDKRIVIDQYLKDYYCNRYPVDPSHVDVIYNGITKDTLTKAAKAAVKKKTDQMGVCHISYIGRLDVDKSPMRLVEIMRLLADKPVVMHIYGDGPLESEMRVRAKKYSLINKSVIFHGYTADPVGVMAQSDFTILTSDAEGIPMSVLESMAAHTPAILPAVGGIPEIVDHDINGILCNITDFIDEEGRVIALAEGVRHAMSLDPAAYEKQRQAARKKIIDRFSRMAEEYTSLLSKG